MVIRGSYSTFPRHAENMAMTLCRMGKKILQVPYPSVLRRFKMDICALAGVAKLVGHHPLHQMVAGSIPDQGTCLGYGLDPFSH